MTVLESFHFLRPAGVLLLLPWVLILALWLRLGRARASSHALAPHLLVHLRLDRGRMHGWLKPIPVTTVMVIIATLVVMGPSWRQQPSAIGQNRAVLVLLLDVSASMTQVDLAPNRLQRAKQKISDLLALQPDRAAALIVYAGSAHEVLPLTRDHGLLLQYLGAITPQLMPRGGKAPEDALPLVDAVLEQEAYPASVLLLTDAPGNDSHAAFADFFRERGHQLLVLGVGAPWSGDAVQPLQARELRNLAALAGGHYVSVTVDDSDMRQLQRRMDSHYLQLPDQAAFWEDGGYPLLFPLLALFLAGFRKGWGIQVCGVLLPVLMLGVPSHVFAQNPDSAAGKCSNRLAQTRWLADLWLSSDQQGWLLLWRGCYREAAERFQDPMWKGVALFYGADFPRAAGYFAQADSEAALFNGANALALGRDYSAALERYEQLLAKNPAFPGAAVNRQRVLELVDAIRQMTEKQQSETGESGESVAPLADGTGVEQTEAVSNGQVSTGDFLNDPAEIDMWLRAVQHDPGEFLAAKFRSQLQARAVEQARE